MPASAPGHVGASYGYRSDIVTILLRVVYPVVRPGHTQGFQRSLCVSCVFGACAL